MPRLALINMAIGFFVLTLAASYGAFIATDLTSQFIHDPALINSWTSKLTQSAHGHTNLFGLLHIALGLTLPYSVWAERVKTFQTIGLGLGTLAMGPLMLIKSGLAPSENPDLISLAIGIGLSAALIALFTQAAGIAVRVLRRG